MASTAGAVSDTAHGTARRIVYRDPIPKKGGPGSSGQVGISISASHAPSVAVTYVDIYPLGATTAVSTTWDVDPPGPGPDVALISPAPSCAAVIPCRAPWAVTTRYAKCGQNLGKIQSAHMEGKMPEYRPNYPCFYSLVVCAAPVAINRRIVHPLSPCRGGQCRPPGWSACSNRLYARAVYAFGLVPLRLQRFLVAVDPWMA